MIISKINHTTHKIWSINNYWYKINITKTNLEEKEKEKEINVPLSEVDVK